MSEPIYRNVPSAWAMTKAQAYKEAVARYGVDAECGREGYAGIAYISNYGETCYVEWDNLPPTTSYYRD